jgi:hypothetical protein
MMGYTARRAGGSSNNLVFNYQALATIVNATTSGRKRIVAALHRDSVLGALDWVDLEIYMESAATTGHLINVNFSCAAPDALAHTYFVKAYDVNASTYAGSASRRRLTLMERA